MGFALARVHVFVPQNTIPRVFFRKKKVVETLFFFSHTSVRIRTPDFFIFWEKKNTDLPLAEIGVRSNTGLYEKYFKNAISRLFPSPFFIEKKCSRGGGN